MARAGGAARRLPAGATSTSWLVLAPCAHADQPAGLTKPLAGLDLFLAVAVRGNCRESRRLVSEPPRIGHAAGCGRACGRKGGADLDSMAGQLERIRCKRARAAERAL